MTKRCYCLPDLKDEMKAPSRKTRKLHHFTLEVAQKELAAAKKRVTELELVVKRLQKEEEQKWLKIQNLNYDLLLEGQTLSLILEWLNPQDHFSCAQVCQEWRDQIDQPFVWEQAARNQSPSLLKDIQLLTKSSSWDFKSISKGLIHKQSTSQFTDGLEWSPKTRLEPHTVFLLVEAKDQHSGHIVGSWHVSFDRWNAPDVSEYSFMNILGSDEKVALPTSSEEDEGFADHSFRNSSSNDMLVNLAESSCHCVVFSARLLRCDTGQSVGIFYEKNFSCLDQDWAFVDLDTIRPDSTTDKGVRALALWSLQGYDSMALWIRCNITPQENHTPNRRQTPTYCLNTLDCNFMVYAKGRSHEKVANRREVLVSMEGLDWQ